MADLLTMELEEDENMDWLMASSANVEGVEDTSKKEMTVEEKEQLENFYKILRKGLVSEPKLFSTHATGRVSNIEQFQTMLRSFKALGYFFAIRTSRIKRQNPRLLTVPPKDIPIQYPYTVGKYVHFYCNAKRSPSSQTFNALSNDCKATLHLREFRVIQDRKLPITKDCRERALRQLRQEVAEGKIDGVPEIWVSVPLPHVHTHRTAPTGYIDSEVKASMYGLLHSGVRTAKEIKQRLNQIVAEDFSNAPVRPNANNLAFFPSEKTIYNHLRHEGLAYKPYERKKKKIDVVRSELMTRLNTLLENVQNCTRIDLLERGGLMLNNCENVFAVLERNNVNWKRH